VPEEVDIIFWGYASVREDWGTTPEDSGMNPRPFLRSAAFDYRSTAQQVKNLIGSAVHGSQFAVRRSVGSFCRFEQQQSAGAIFFIISIGDGF